MSAWTTPAAQAVFAAWLVLFAGGILVDTKPHRVAISAEGARALDTEVGSSGSSRLPESDDPASTGIPLTRPARSTIKGVPTSLAIAWVVVLTCFMPLNLAWLCVASSALGAFGNRVVLADDGDVGTSVDMTHPYLSALLRGFFVYLFLMSGLLLLDEAPFANGGPAQYVRLAGFLSLFSFMVSYQPRLFRALISVALERIQVRDASERQEPANGGSDKLHATIVRMELEGGAEPARNDPPGSDRLPDDRRSDVRV